MQVLFQNTFSKTFTVKVKSAEVTFFLVSLIL